MIVYSENKTSLTLYSMLAIFYKQNLNVVQSAIVFVITYKQLF